MNLIFGFIITIVLLLIGFAILSTAEHLHLWLSRKMSSSGPLVSFLCQSLIFILEIFGAWIGAVWIIFWLPFNFIWGLLGFFITLPVAVYQQIIVFIKSRRETPVEQE